MLSKHLRKKRHDNLFLSSSFSSSSSSKLFLTYAHYVQPKENLENQEKKVKRKTKSKKSKKRIFKDHKWFEMNPDSRRNSSDLTELLLGYVTGKLWYYIKGSLIQRFMLELQKLSLTNGRS